jgi:ribosomal protein S18 acetylase RimI-like enzyme
MAGPDRPTLEIRFATLEDVPSLGRLIAEALAHYAMPVPDDAEIERALAEQLPKVEILLALGEDGLLGFASFSMLFPGLGLEPQIYMKDLYIAARARKQGIARALMRALAGIARTRGCVRIDWTTERDNLQAQAAYEALGAAILDEKIYYRLDAQAIARLAEDT